MNTIYNRETLLEEIERLAEICKSIDEPNAAIALYTLAGSMHLNTDYVFSLVCKKFAEEDMKLIEAGRAKLN